MLATHAFLASALRQAALAVYPALTDDVLDAIEITRGGDDGTYDRTTTFAMKLAPVVAQSPQEIAQKLADALQDHIAFSKVESAGAGYINFWVKPCVFAADLRHCLDMPMTFGAFYPVPAETLFAARYVATRCASVLKYLGATNWPDGELAMPHDHALLGVVVDWPRIAARGDASSTVSYIEQLTSAFERRWQAGEPGTVLRFLTPDNPALSLARGALVAATRQTMAAALASLGHAAPDELEME